MREDLRDLVGRYLRDTTESIIVDEVFDANNVDLGLVLTAMRAGVGTTLIGDPWQALYEFRGARPDLVPELVAREEFSTFPISESFRFVTEEMQALTSDLREGKRIRIPTGPIEEMDVLLASTWDALWAASPSVLPMSFGRIDNQTDAAIVLLLDQLVSAHFGQRAIYVKEATTLLELDPDTVMREGRGILVPVLETLRAGNDDAAEGALRHLREAMKRLGSTRQLRRLPSSSEEAQLGRMRALACRIEESRLIPGLTVHQAKGREWHRVGVFLQPNEVARLGEGLKVDDAEDRRLYVALTRAREITRSITGQT